MAERIDLKIEYKNSTTGAWEDLTADVLSDSIVWSYGIRSRGPLDRTAGVGRLEFKLMNGPENSAKTVGYYTPGFGRCRSGFKDDAFLRLTLIYDYEERRKFYGKLKTYVDTDLKITRVTARDWIDIAARFPFRQPSYVESKRIDEVIPLILAKMTIQPQATELNTGEEVFPDIFDTVRETTKALGEIDKIAQSELGYVYIKYGRWQEEVLCVEGRYTRANKPLKKMELPNHLSGTLLLENGLSLFSETGDALLINGESFEARLHQYIYGTPYDIAYLLVEDNSSLLLETGDRALLDLAAITDIQNPVLKMPLSTAQIYNSVQFTVYPRYVDLTNNTVLFNYPSTIQLAPGETKSNLVGRYRDPIAVARVNGRDMQAPVAGTDYLANSLEDGTGTNLTADLFVVATYGTESVTYNLTNTGASQLFVTKLQARGRGIYTYDPLSQVIADTSSQNEIGINELRLDQKYIRNPNTLVSYGQAILDQYRSGALEPDSVLFLANWNPQMACMAIEMEPGDSFALQNLDAGLAGDYFINGVEYRYESGKLFVTWVPKSANYSDGNYWTLDTSELDVSTVLGY